MRTQIDMRILLEVEKYIAKYELVRKRVLFKLGGYIQKTMQRSMRYKKPGERPSSRGYPPKALKTNPRLRKGIGFVVEERRGSVVIGPDTYDKRRRGGGARPAASGMTVPRLLNEGGTILVPQRVREGDLQPTGVIRAEIKPRPFVEPSRKKGEERFLELLAKNQIRR